MEPEPQPKPDQTPVDIAWEHMQDSWHEAFRCYNIWDSAMDLDLKKNSPVTSAAVDSAFDEWIDAKDHAIQAEMKFAELQDAEEHANECVECKAKLESKPVVKAN